jgi:hypothetical protein
MKNTMNKNLGNLIAENINLDLFFSMTTNEIEVSLIGYFTPKTEKHLISKGFELFNYLYPDDDSSREYKKGSIRIVLFEN